MAVTIPEPYELVTPGDLGDELASFTRAMRSTNVSPNTILAYGGAVRQFGVWMMANGRTTTVADRRDDALIRVLFDTGARRHEIASLRYSPTDPADRDVDTGRATVRVLGKGGKDNVIAVSDRTLSALDDYLRARRKHPHADLPYLWLGQKGRLTDSGIAQTLRDRGRRVGIPDLHAHDFRHAATHHELANGMNEADVMSKRGWGLPGDAQALCVDHGERAGDSREPEARAGGQAVMWLLVDAHGRTRCGRPGCEATIGRIKDTYGQGRWHLLGGEWVYGPDGRLALPYRPVKSTDPRNCRVRWDGFGGDRGHPATRKRAERARARAAITAAAGRKAAG